MTSSPARSARSGTEPLVEMLDVMALRIPTSAPEADGTLQWDATTMVVVRAVSEAHTGLGWTYGPTACAELIASELVPIVQYRPVMDIAGTWLSMVQAIRNATRPGVAGYALSAVDTALWDLKARVLGLPLHHLFGAVRDRVPVYGSGGFTTYSQAQLAEQVGRWIDEHGIGRVKIKIGESWGRREERDLERVAFTRKIIGDDVGLLVDANGAYGRKQAVRMGQRLNGFDVEWFEEPVSSDDLEGLRAVRARVGADVAAGEYGGDLTYFRRMCEAGSVDCLQVDASRCGGFSEWIRVAALAASHHLEVSSHCAPNLHRHVAATTMNLRHLEWFHDHVRIESLLLDGAVQPTDGCVHVDEELPGNGLSLRETDAEEFRAW